MMDVDEEETWIDGFLNLRGHELMCEVDTEFITDRFNLTGLNTEGMRLQDIMNIITGPLDANAVAGLQALSANGVETHNSDSEPDDLGMDVEYGDAPRAAMVAAHFYGMVHARFILTMRGLQKMAEKYQDAEFGRCPRTLCRGHPVLPVGMHDAPKLSSVKLYCPKCEDLYHTHGRHANIDSAYFGTSFPAMFFQVFPKQVPRHSEEQFVLKAFGFKLHDHGELARWQQKQRQDQERRIAQAGLRWY